MDKLVKELLRVIDDDLLFPAYQPIAAIDGRGILGYEAFVHGPADSPLHAPQGLAFAAEVAGCTLRLEGRAIEAAIRQFEGLGLPGRLLRRFSPLYFASTFFTKEARHLRDAFARAGLIAAFGDRLQGGDSEVLHKGVAQCRESGILVAWDELLILTQSSKQVRRLAPDYVILDRHYCQGIQADPAKQRLVRRVQEAAGPDAQVIAQGVDSEEEYQAIRRLGVPLAQGGWFGRATPHPPIALVAPRPPPDPASLREGAPHTDRVGELVQAAPFIAPTERTGDVLALFLRSPTLTSLPVVQQGEPVGLIRREGLTNLFVTPFGRDLYARAPILQFMDLAPLVVEADDPIKRVSRLITERGQTQENGEFIITRQGLYLGIGRVVDVLRRITEMQIRDASHANPLTGLPGNVRIQEEVSGLLAAGAPFTACWVDLDHFKPFNDRYGYERGDQALLAVARLLTEAAEPEADFVGHVGGDDFICLFRSPDWEARCRQVLDRFAALAPELYDADDRERGGIAAKDRQGNDQFFGLLALSIGAVQPIGCRSHHCVATMATEAKKQAKGMPGNALFLERRSPAGAL